MANGIFEVDGFVPEEIEVIDKDGVSYLLDSLEDGNGLEIWKMSELPKSYVLLECVECDKDSASNSSKNLTGKIL